MKTRIFTLILVLVSLLGIESNVFAQARGDYVATTSGDYNTAANWSISNGAGGYTGTATSAPTTAINVWIPEGKIMTTAAQANAQNMNISGELNTGNFTVQLGTNASTTVGNLIITSTGKLRSANATGGSVNSLNIYGTTIQVDGQLGAATDNNFTAYFASTNPDGGGGFRVYCLGVKANETTTVTVAGSGKINVARFYGSSQTTGSAPQVININTDINILNNNTVSVAAFGSIGNTGGSDRTINISSGKTVKFTGETPRSSLHRDAVTVGNYTSGDFIYNVFGSLDMGKGTIRLYTSYTSGNAKGAYLNVKNGGTLIVGDTIRLQLGQASGQTCGIFPESGSTVKFGQGATISTQFRNNIGAAQAAFPTSYFNIDVENTAGISIPNNFSMAGTLNVNQNFTGTNITLLPGAKANIAASKTLTADILNLNSSSSGTATLINNGTLTNTNASVQQYLPDTRNWYVSSPVTGAVAPAGYTYVAGKGYIALPTAAASTLQFNGTLNSGNINVSLTKSGTGFNLIGNPYPCHLGWTYDFVNANSTLIESSIWVRTNAGVTNNSGQWSFATFNATSSESVPLEANNGIIAPMEAFWVKAKVAGTLTFDDNLIKSHQSSNPLKAPAAKKSDRQRIRLEISNGSTTDETLLYFDGDASNAFDAYDSPKFAETKDVQVYTSAGTEKLVINGLNTITDNMLIPLGVKTAQSGTFTLKPIQLDNMASDTKVYLVDGQSQTELELNSEYTFTSDATDNSSRFSLLFKVPSLTTQIENIANKPAFNVYRIANGQLAVTIYETLNSTSKLTISNQLGQKLSEKSLAGVTTVINEPLTAGVYFVTVSSNGKSSTQKIIFN
jgi:hypothetical protein